MTAKLYSTMVIVSDQISMVLSNRRPFSMCQCQYHSAKFVRNDPFIDAHSCTSFCPSLIPRLLTGESLGMRPLLSLSLPPLKHSVILLNQCCLLHHQLSVLPITLPHIQPQRNHIYSPFQMRHQFAGAKLLSLPQRTPSAELQCTCASHQED